MAGKKLWNMGAVRKELESIGRGFEPSGGIVADHGLEVLEDLELEDPTIGVVRAELLVKVGPGDGFGACDTARANRAPCEPGIEVNLQWGTKLLDDVHVNRDRSRNELVEEVGVEEEPRVLFDLVPPELTLVAEVVTGVAFAPVGDFGSLRG